MMKHEGYFEGILQLRNVKEEVINFAVRFIEKKDRGMIAKVKDVKNGVDIYMAPQKLLRSLGTKLQNNFGGQLTVSTKLHTKNHLTSKEVYRVNVLFRMPNFKKGDVVIYKGDKIKILAMHKKVNAKVLDSGKKLVLNYKDLRT